MGEEIKIIIVLFNAFFVLFILGPIIFFRQYIIKKKQYETKIKLKEEQHKKELLNTQLEIQQQTMSHIGREIHDNLGQKLTLASLNIQKLMLNKEFQNATNSLNTINQIINESLSMLRGLSKTLTDNSLDYKTFFEIVNEEVYKINQLNHFKINIDFDETIDFDYQQKVVLFRITQEFIQNSIKYAKCSSIDLILKIENYRIIYILKDNGIGFDLNSIENKGIGINNMKKRIEFLNGSININSKINLGTTVEIYIPLNYEKNDSNSR